MQVEGYQYASAGNRMRLRMFNVLDDVKRDHAFAPIVTCPSGAPLRTVCCAGRVLGGGFRA